MPFSFLGQDTQQKTKEKIFRANTVFPILLSINWSVHFACGERGELWLPRDRQRAKLETVAQGMVWLWSALRALLFSALLVRMCHKAISWSFVKAMFCSHTGSWCIYFNRSFEHMQLSLNLFFRKRRMYLGRNWIYIPNKKEWKKKLIRFLCLRKTFTDYRMVFAGVENLGFGPIFLYSYLKCTKETCLICWCM